MSLRTRLVLLTVALVVLVVVSLSAMLLNGLVEIWSADALEKCFTTRQQVGAFVLDHIDQHSADGPAPSTLEEFKIRWSRIVAEDDEIASMLRRAMANNSRAILEINVAGADGNILTSSDPSRIGARIVSLPEFEGWRDDNFVRRLYDLYARRPNYQVIQPLGIQEPEVPLFTVQVVASSVLLRDTLDDRIRDLGLIAAGLLILAVLLSVGATNLALGPLKRIDQTIDRIVAGEFTAGGADAHGSPEFQQVEKKLNVLGQQFEGARKGAAELRNNVDQLLERLASQLDVATRLAAISRLTGGVAHEIKNPLNAIALRVELLRAKLGGAEVDGEIDVLAREVRRLDRVVKTFLDFTRPVEVAMQEVDLANLAREVTDLMSPQAKLQQVDVEFAAEGPALMQGDPDMLKQAVLNLVTNGVEAMKEGGTLKVEVANSGGLATLRVQDRGTGIRPDLRDKVFQLYFTTKERGSGIGLAMTYRAVQLHNGTIDFASELGKGTTFQLRFPAVVRNA